MQAPPVLPARVPGRPSPVVVAVVTAVCVAFAGVCSATARLYAPALWWQGLPFMAVAAGFLVAGAVAWAAGPIPRAGLLTLCYGTAAFVNDLVHSPLPPVAGLASCLGLVFWALGVHTTLLMPYGVLGSRPVRVTVVGAYAGSLLLPVAVVVSAAPGAGLWLLVSNVQVVVVGLVTVVVLVRRWARESPARRRAVAPPLAAGATWSLSFVALAVCVVVRAAPPAEQALLTVLTVGSLGTVAVAVGWALVQTRRAERRLLTIALQPGAGSPRLLEHALATAVGDPQLRMRPAAGPADHPAPGARRPVLVPRAAPAATPVRCRDGTVVVIHDQYLSPGLVDLVAASARAALERRAAEIVLGRSAADAAPALAERHRIQRDLHDAVQPPLFAASMLVGLAKEHLNGPLAGSPAAGAIDRAGQQIEHAVSSLRELVLGIPPRALTEHGLAAALTELCARSPVPVTLHARPGRWPVSVEVTAYFVVAEALGNVHRHAGATGAVVTLTATGDGLDVEVVDDGRGGAHVGGGTGLVGLRERVAALGGSLAVGPREGGGTLLRAGLPVEHRWEEAG